MYPINFTKNLRTERVPSHIFNAFLSKCLSANNRSSKDSWERFFKIAIIDHHGKDALDDDQSSFINAIGPLISADMRVYQSKNTDKSYSFFPLTSTIINPKPRHGYYGNELFRILSKYDPTLSKSLVDFYVLKVDNYRIPKKINEEFLLNLTEGEFPIDDEIELMENDEFKNLMLNYSKQIKNIIDNDNLYFIQKIKYIGNLLSFYIGMINQLHPVITSGNGNKSLRPFFFSGLPAGDPKGSCEKLSNQSFLDISAKAVDTLIYHYELDSPSYAIRDEFRSRSRGHGYNTGFMNHHKTFYKFYFETQLLVSIIAATVKEPMFFDDWSDLLFNDLGISLGGGHNTKIDQVENMKIQTQKLSGVSDTLNKNSELMKDRLVKLRLGASYSDLGVEINPL